MPEPPRSKVEKKDKDQDLINRLKEGAKQGKKVDAAESTIQDEKNKVLFDRLKKQRLVLQGADKVVFEGDFLDIHENFFVLSDVVITGPKHIARPAWVLVDRDSISHIHPLCEVEEKK